MQDDSKHEAQAAMPGESPVTAPTRADAYRERFRHAQAIAAQVARARAAGGQPSDAEAARLVAEFHARGGQVTICPQVEEAAPAEGGRGGRNSRS